MPPSVPLSHASGVVSLSPESQGVAVGLSPQTKELLAMGSAPIPSSTATPATFSMDDSLDEDLIHNAASSLEAVSKELAVLNSQTGGSPDFTVPATPKPSPENPPVQAALEEKRNFSKPGPLPAPTPTGNSVQLPLTFLAEQALALGQPPPDKKVEGAGHKEASCQAPANKLLEVHPAKQKHPSLPRPAHGSQTSTPVPSPQGKGFPVGTQPSKPFPSSPSFAKLQSPKAPSPLPQRPALQQQIKSPVKAPSFHSSPSASSTISPASSSSHKTPNSSSSSLSYSGKHSSSSSSSGQSYKSPFVALSRHVASSSSTSTPSMFSSQSASSGSLLQSTPVSSSGLTPSRSLPSSTVKKIPVPQKLTLVAPPGGPNVSSSGGTQGVAKLLTSSLKPVVVSSAASSTSVSVSGLWSTNVAVDWKHLGAGAWPLFVRCV